MASAAEPLGRVAAVTSEHAWLSQGRKLYLIAVIDHATSRVLARVVESDCTEANLGVREL
jgi:hypothetical protein